MMSFNTHLFKILRIHNDAIARHLCLCLLFWFLAMQPALAGSLADRLSQFPNWQTKPVVNPASGDLIYPDWLAGTWQVTLRLLEQVAPLAPDLVTPGFDRNRRYLNQPISFAVRFVPDTQLSKQPFGAMPLPLVSRQRSQVVADRAFNGINLARAYLGDQTVMAVTVDPTSPNRQVTRLSNDRALISVVTGRDTEQPSPNDFLTTELFQQIFRSGAQPYLNQVETTTAYRYQPTSSLPIVADQVTAVYLSPQDPNYFKAGDRPVALYRYRLEFSLLN